MKNEEIKEILECLKKHDILNGSQDSYLYDYITKLQQDIENYVKITLHDRKEIERLQQENERLRMRNNMLREDIDSFIEDNNKRYEREKKDEQI